MIVGRHPPAHRPGTAPSGHVPERCMRRHRWRSGPPDRRRPCRGRRTRVGTPHRDPATGSGTLRLGAPKRQSSWAEAPDDPPPLWKAVRRERQARRLARGRRPQPRIRWCSSVSGSRTPRRRDAPRERDRARHQRTCTAGLRSATCCSGASTRAETSSTRTSRVARPDISRENPWAAFALSWKELDRQVCVTGEVERTSDAESDAYFASRPREARVRRVVVAPRAGCWIRATSLMARFVEFDAKYPGDDIPRPPFWGGYRIVPDTVEFWQARAYRLHEIGSATPTIRTSRRGGGWSDSRRSAAIVFAPMSIDELRARIAADMPQTIADLERLVRIPSKGYPGDDPAHVRAACAEGDARRPGLGRGRRRPAARARRRPPGRLRSDRRTGGFPDRSALRPSRRPTGRAARSVGFATLRARGPRRSPVRTRFGRRQVGSRDPRGGAARPQRRRSGDGEGVGRG